MNSCLPEIRFKLQPGGLPMGSVDTTGVPILMPMSNPWDYFFIKKTGKSRFHAFKYEVVKSIHSNGPILWVNGPLKARVHDMAIYRDRLQDQIPAGQWLIGDSA
jgi:hypothetical protein